MGDCIIVYKFVRFTFGYPLDFDGKQRSMLKPTVMCAGRTTPRAPDSTPAGPVPKFGNS